MPRTRTCPRAWAWNADEPTVPGWSRSSTPSGRDRGRRWSHFSHESKSAIPGRSVSTSERVQLAKAPSLPLPLRLLNTVGRLTPAGHIDRFRLDKATVLTEASKATGLSDFGNPGFEKGLDALLMSIAEDVDPHLVGQIALRQAITDALTNRLLLTRERQRRPWVFDQPLRLPIIVTGLHRSGTTYLHRLLAQDPHSYAPPYWHLIAPVKPTGTHDLRRQRARRSLALRTKMMPDLNRMHTIDADAPEECLYLTASSFESVFFWAMAPVTGYLKWYLDHDRTQKYVEIPRVAADPARTNPTPAPSVESTRTYGRPVRAVARRSRSPRRADLPRSGDRFCQLPQHGKSNSVPHRFGSEPPAGRRLIVGSFRR